MSKMVLRRHVAALLAVPLLGAAGMAAADDQPALAPLAPSAHACHGVDGYAAAFGGRRTFFVKPDQLTAIKARNFISEPLLCLAFRVARL